MNILVRILWAFLYMISFLPFWVFHLISNVFYFLAYYVIRYRRKVVRSNLVKSFPEKPLKEIVQIEKKFYLGFCDLIFETIKTITVSKEELLSRCILKTPTLMQKLYDQKVNVMGAAGHTGNWEWMNLCLALQSKQQIYGIYKPLSNKFLDDTMIKNRSRFGTLLVASKNLKLLVKELDRFPFAIGVFADQAPHFYPKAFVVQFLNQKTYVVTGPGLMVSVHGMWPIWGWMRRVGRSRYEMGLEELDQTIPAEGLSAEDQAQVTYLAEQLQISEQQVAVGLRVTQDFYKRLEEKIKMAPQDWLWSHRRWKNR